MRIIAYKRLFDTDERPVTIEKYKFENGVSIN